MLNCHRAPWQGFVLSQIVPGGSSGTGMGQGPVPAVSMAEAILFRVWKGGEESLVYRSVFCHLATQLLLPFFVYWYRHSLLVQQNPTHSPSHCKITGHTPSS